ncbi:hypothetical protein E2C01_032680 [Portunus trituberculatus]|uniref:Uncharacterized protein n=1 Tax=Portunus trituberculatus TaxID=210409 RepID=A0A5B7F120_PORTR|nr:hypothetical protein [Portunus trituberculatus]
MHQQTQEAKEGGKDLLKRRRRMAGSERQSKMVMQGAEVDCHEKLKVKGATPSDVRGKWSRVRGGDGEE